MGKKKAKKKATVTPTEAKAGWAKSLPPKMQQKFKQLLKSYENAAYKNAIKFADTVLKECPNNGETLSMKGLVLQTQDKWDEARPFVEKGLEQNKTSRTCWNIYALMQRHDNEYEKAREAFKKAHEIEPNHMRIATDLAALQMQTRDFKGNMDTRNKILQMKAQNQQCWIHYGLASYLAKQHATAIEVLETYEQQRTKRESENVNPKRKNVIPDPDPKNDYEMSELLLFKAKIKEDAGYFDEAWEILNGDSEQKNRVVDKTERLKMLIRVLPKLDKTKTKRKVAALWRELVEYNVENTDYHRGYLESLGVDPYSAEGHAKVKELYSELETKFPKANSLKRMPLTYTKGEEFKRVAGEYFQFKLSRAVSSLFSDLRPIYDKEPEKIPVFESLVKSYISELKASDRFTPDQKPSSAGPACRPWALFYLANHCHYLGRDTEALEIADQLISETPTTPEFYVLKAQIYKHGGDHTTAYKWMEEARTLDFADRYLNTKCTRFALRANEMAEAEKTVSLFLRDGDNLTGLQSLQVMWYEIEKARAHARLGQWGQALKELHHISDHFKTICHDQIDFHPYVGRKLTFGIYLNMIKWQDSLRTHHFFRQAAELALELSLKLAELSKKAPPGTPLKNVEGPYERSKPPERKDKDNKPANWNRDPPKEDADPWGTKLFDKDLGEGFPNVCLRLFVAPLEAHAGPKDVEASVLSVRLRIVRGDKLALAAKGLMQLRLANPDHPALLELLPMLFKRAEDPDIPAMGKKLITMFKPKLLPKEAGGSPAKFVSGALAAHPNSLLHAHAGYKGLRAAGDAAGAERVAQSLSACLSGTDRKLAFSLLQEAEKTTATLRAHSSPALPAFLAASQKRFPFATFCRVAE